MYNSLHLKSTKPQVHIQCGISNQAFECQILNVVSGFWTLLYKQTQAEIIHTVAYLLQERSGHTYSNC